MANPKGNIENLQLGLSSDEARKRGHKGGVNSGITRRRKRDARSAAKLVLDLPCASGNLENFLTTMHVDEKDFTNRVAMFARAFQKAIIDGDINAMRFIVDTAGETPQQKLNEKRLDFEMSQIEESSNVADEWVSAVCDVDKEEKQEAENGENK